MLGAEFPYREQAEVLLKQVEAAIRCYPQCVGLYALYMITPEIFQGDNENSLSKRFINLYVNASFFNITDTDEMIVDTMGLNVLGGADVQVYFKNMDPNNVVNYVYNIANYQFDNDFPIKSGETMDSIDGNGDMQYTPQWKTMRIL